MTDGSGRPAPQKQPNRQRTGLRAALALMGFFFLLAATVLVAGGQPDPMAQDVAAAVTTTERPTDTPTTSPTPSPTVPTATPSHTPTQSATPTQTATPTWTPSPSATATPTITWTPTSTPSPTSTPEPAPTAVATSVLTEDVMHVLLIGGDRDYVFDQNTDTLIVAVINRKTHQVSMLSIPRDLWVYIPEYGYGRINIAQRIGYRIKYADGAGPGLLIRTIEENLGIPIDHWARVGYEGFARAVDELGGVDLLVPCRTNLQYKPPTSDEQQEIVLEPGMHHLDGPTALRYVRTRRGDSDFERAQRQQRFIKGVWEQFKSPGIILKIPGLWSALKGAFQTDLNLGDVLALAPTMLDLERENIRSLYIGRYHTEPWTSEGGASVLLPIPERIQEVVARLYAPPVDDGDATAPALVAVQNGSGRPYMAHIAADQLRWAGFEVESIGTAERVDYARTWIYVYNEKPEALAELASLLNVRERNIVRQPDPGQEADMLVILGADYDPCR
jgi:LCP family protein required for cell wall assembly